MDSEPRPAGGGAPSPPPDRDLREQEAAALARRLEPSRARRRRVVRMLLLFGAVEGAHALRRLLDWILAAALVLVLLPLWALLASAPGVRWSSRTRLGRWAEPFEERCWDLPSGGPFRVMTALGLQRTPVLVNILRGEMSFVGPRAAAPDELSPAERLHRRRYEVRPGLVGPHWVRQRTNIAWDPEPVLDAEYAETRSLAGDLALAARALPAALYGGGTGEAPDTLHLLGLRLDNLTMSDALDRIEAFLEGSEPRRFCFINADCANLTFRHPDYREALEGSDLNLADGIGVKLAGRLLRRPLRENVNGTDLFPRLCARLEASGRGLFLLGARPGVTDGVAEWLAANHPGVRLCGHRHGYFDAHEEEAVVEEIRSSGAELLLVAFGAPRQDLWVARHLPRLGVRAAAGVGGLFDFYSGRVERAPVWLRELGLEWTWRLVQEPGRMWRRYLVGNWVFLYRVLREKLSEGAERNR